MSTRLGAAPRTPTNDRRPKIRRFGTVLSVNSPVTTPSIPKKHARIRGDNTLQHHLTTTTIPEENEDDTIPVGIPASESRNNWTATKYTVTFDAGPIGLQINPDNWCVQQIIGTDSPAAQMIDVIAIGDIVVAVNGKETKQANNDNYDDIYSMLQDGTTSRTITFQRPSNNNVIDTIPTASKVLPTNDVENRKPIPGAARLRNRNHPSSPVPQPRSLTFGDHPKCLNKKSSTEHPTKAAETTFLPPHSDQTVSEPSSIQNELELSRNETRKLQMRLQAIETENELLRHPPQQQIQQSKSNLPLNAIREMEYKMRIQSLEDQLRQSNESKAKVKEHNKRMNQMLVHQSENHQRLFMQKEQELHDVILSSKETTKELKTTRKELVDAKKHLNDKIDLLERDNDKLQSALDQKMIDLERHDAEKVLSDARQQQLEDIRIDLDDQVLRLRNKLEETESRTQETNNDFLQVIRTKDEEMEKLRIDMVATQTINAKLQTDLTEKDAQVRHVTADLEQITIEKQSITKEVMNLSSTLEMTYNEKERLTIQLSQLESKLRERNDVLDNLNGSIKVLHDESAEKLTVKNEAIAKLNESQIVVCAERDRLKQLLLDAQALLQSSNYNEIQLRRDLATDRLELDTLRQSSTIEKCNLLKQLEGLEGELISCRKEIQNQVDTISESTIHLHAVTNQRDEVLKQLDTERDNVTVANKEIQRFETIISEWMLRYAMLEKECTTSLELSKTQLHTALQKESDLTTANKSLMERVVTQQRSLMSACHTEMILRADQKKKSIDISELQQSHQRDKAMHLNDMNILQSKLLSNNTVIESLSIECNNAISKGVTLESEIVRLQINLTSIESALETAIIQNIETEVRYETLVESSTVSRQELNTKLTLRKSQLKQVLGKYNDLKTIYKKQTATLLESHETSAVHAEVITRLHEELAAASASLENLEETTRREKDEFCETIRKVDMELGDVKHLLDVSRKSFIEATADLVSARSTISDLLLKVSTLEDKCQELRTQSDVDRSIFMSEKKLMEDTEQKLAAQVQQQSEELLHSERQRRNIHDEVLELRNVVVTKDNELLEIHSKMLSISTELEMVSSFLEVSESNLISMSNTAQNAESEAASLKRSIISKQEELDLKINEFAALSLLVAKLESENGRVISEISRKESEVAQLEMGLKQAAETNNSNVATTAELKNSIVDLQHRYDSECASKDLAIDEVTHERDTAVAERQRLHEMNEIMKEKEFMLQSEVDQLRFNLTNAEADFQKSDELYAGQASELKKFHQKFTEQKSRADKLLRELQQSESSIDSVSRMLDSTNAQVFSLKQSLLFKQKEFEKELNIANTELKNALQSNKMLTVANKEHLETITYLEAAFSNANKLSISLQQKLGIVKSELSICVSAVSAAESDFLQKQGMLQREIISLNSFVESRDSQIIALEEKLDSSENAVNQLSHQLSESKNELNCTKQNISMLQMKLDELKQHEVDLEIKSSQVWSAKLDEISKQHNIRLSKANEKISAKDKELKASRTTNDATLDKCETLKEALCKMEDSNKSLFKNLTTVKLELYQLNSDFAGANDRLNLSESQLCEKSRTLSAAENRIIERDIQILDLKERIETLLHESSVASNLLADEIVLLKQQLDVALLQRNEVETKFKTLQRQYSDRDFEMERLHEEVRVQNETVNGLTASAAASQWTLECKIEALNSEVEKYRELSSELNSECKGLKSKLDSVHAKIDSLNDLHSLAVTRFETVESQMLEHQKELEEKLLNEKNLTTKIAEELHTLKLERNREVSEASTAKRHFEETITLLEHEASLRSQRHNDWTRDREMERTQFHQCREELQESITKVSSLEDCLAKTKEDVTRLITQSEQKNEENSAVIEQQSRSYSEEKLLLQQENVRLQKNVRTSSSDCKSLTLSLRSVEDQLITLQSEMDAMGKEKKSLLFMVEERDETIQILQSELKEHHESSLDIANDSPLKTLSKCELRNRCSLLQDNLIDAENRLNESTDVVNRRSEHVKQLVTDLDVMSTEISRLVTANELLEARVYEVTFLNEASEASIANAQKVIDGLKTQLKNRSAKLDEMSLLHESLTDELQLLRMKSKSEQRSFANDNLVFEQDRIRMRQELEDSVAKSDQAENSLLASKLELVSMRQNEEKFISTRKQLEQEVECISNKFTVAMAEAKKELKSQVSCFEQHILNLESECATLRSKISEFQLETENKDLLLNESRESERLLADDLTKQRQKASVVERQREEIAAKLTEATRVVASQRSAIKKLELRLIESDRKAVELTEHTEALQVAHQQTEETIDQSHYEQYQRNRDMEAKIRKLEEARHIAIQDGSNVQDELRKLRLEFSEIEKVNVSLKSQMSDLVYVSNTTKAQMTEAKMLKDDSQMLLRKLANELDNKQMEIDHLKAKNQVSTATAARLKANALLQQSSCQKEIDTTAASLCEVEKLRGELRNCSSKVTSISDVCKSQEEALIYSRKLESQLVRFIEEIISEMDNVLGNIAVQAETLYEYADMYQVYDGLKSLDLAGFDHRECNPETLRTTLDGISVLIPHAATQLDERRAQLSDWKAQRSDQNCSTTATTPTSKRTDGVPATPEILDTLNRMKHFLKADILSPIKIRTAQSDQLDVEFFKQVIRTLEGNIDVLLQDLQAANVTLHEKDERIFSLEMLIASNESTDRNVHAPLERPTRYDTSKDSTNHEFGSQMEASLPTKEQNVDVDGRRRAAGLLILHAMEGRTNAAKAVAFRRWSCQTSVMRTIAKHGHTASALAQQLEETREKLMILKRHLKKARRTTGSGGGSTLDRIPENEFEL